MLYSCFLKWQEMNGQAAVYTPLQEEKHMRYQCARRLLQAGAFSVLHVLRRLVSV